MWIWPTSSTAMGADVPRRRHRRHQGPRRAAARAAATYSIIPDQIEAGTYMAAAAATGGEVLVKNVIPKHLDCITAKLGGNGRAKSPMRAMRCWCESAGHLNKCKG